ncbi:MAG: radical SAM/SPASM domain-containing protein [Spirochaetia bacterium]
MKKRFGDLWQSLSTGLLDTAVRIKPIRKWALHKGEKELFDVYVAQNRGGLPQKVQEMRCYALVNLLNSVEKAVGDGRISPGVRKTIINNFVGGLVVGEKNRTAAFQEQFGHKPPTFITISPTKSCNLQCKGCYAGSSASERDTLSYAVFSKILKEKKEKWGSYFTVISGGEPFMYRSEGKTIFDVFEENSESYFMVYTNGTLIDEKAARKLAELGNVTPAISVEGWEKETDDRRGEGTFKKIQQAMDNLRDAGVPFGVSITATKENAEIILADDFIDYYFDEKGAVYGWIFQYMPIGRSYTVDLMVTPEQRKWMLERELEMIYDKRLFLMDFWNGGIMSVGCFSGAKPGGYFYIDWNGNITPCVFFPYSVLNVNDVYAKGETLSDAIETEFFKSIRRWQESYEKDGDYLGNLFLPCPMRDHHRAADKILKEHSPNPIDENAAKALSDQEYKERMFEYEEVIRDVMEPVWLEKVYGRTESEESEQAVKKRFLHKVRHR